MSLPEKMAKGRVIVCCLLLVVLSDFFFLHLATMWLDIIHKGNYFCVDQMKRAMLLMKTFHRDATMICISSLILFIVGH
jgi:hypothetical protein